MAKDQRPKWTPTPQIEAGIQVLEDLGIYGDTPTRVINTIVGQELRRLLASGVVTRDELRAALKAMERAKKEAASSRL